MLNYFLITINCEDNITKVNTQIELEFDKFIKNFNMTDNSKKSKKEIEKIYKKNKEEMKKFVKTIFEFTSKNRKYSRDIFNIIFQKLNQTQATMFWDYISDNLSNFADFIKKNSDRYIKDDSNNIFCEGFLLSLRENNQDINLINIFNNNKLFSKFRKEFDSLNNCYDNEWISFLSSIVKNDELFKYWNENLLKDVQDHMFDSFWPKKKSFQRRGDIDKVNAIYLIFFDQILKKSDEDISKNFIFFFNILKLTGYYLIFLDRFDYVTNVKAMDVTTLRDLNKEQKNKLKSVLILFATSEDQNLRTIFIDLITNSQKAKYFKSILGLCKEDIEKIINTQFYNKEEIQLISNYVK